MPYSLDVTEGTYHFGPTEGQMHLKIWKDGMLSRLGHDLTLGFSGYSLVSTVESGGESARFELSIPRSSFVVLEPSSMMDTMKREVLQNIEKHLPGDIHVEGTLQSISAAEIKLQATARLNGRQTPLSMHCRLQGGRLTGSTKLTHKQFHIKPFKAPLGVLKIKDEMDFSFSFVWPEPQAG